LALGKVTHKSGELADLEWVEIVWGFFKKQLHIVEQEEATVK